MGLRCRSGEGRQPGRRPCAGHMAPHDELALYKILTGGQIDMEKTYAEYECEGDYPLRDEKGRFVKMDKEAR